MISIVCTDFLSGISRHHSRANRRIRLGTRSIVCEKPHLCKCMYLWCIYSRLRLQGHSGFVHSLYNTLSSYRDSIVRQDTGSSSSCHRKPLYRSSHLADLSLKISQHLYILPPCRLQLLWRSRLHLPTARSLGHDIQTALPNAGKGRAAEKGGGAKENPIDDHRSSARHIRREAISRFYVGRQWRVGFSCSCLTNQLCLTSSGLIR